MTFSILPGSKPCTCVRWKGEAVKTKGIRIAEGGAFILGKQSKGRAENGRKNKES